MQHIHHKRKQQPAPVQLLNLFLIELTNWRWSWRTQLLTSTIAPLVSIAGLGLFAHGSSQGTLAYILTGNLIMSLSFGMLDKVQSHFIYMRITGGLDYFATLPVRRSMLILAMVLAFLVLMLPSLAITITFGSLFLGISLSPNPLLLLAIPLCAIPLAGIGALIAAYTRSPEDAGAISLFVTVGLLAVGPVVIPPERLPSFMLLLGYLSPATYAASALRQTLLGTVSSQLFLDLTVLIGLSLAIFWFIGRKLALRQA